jgi:ribosome-binding factor A
MSKVMSQRQQRVAQVVHEVVAEQILRVGTNSLTGGFFSVSRVWVSPDLKQASVFFTTFGPQTMTPKAMVENLNLNHGVFGRALGKQLTTKYTPKLRFVFDEEEAEAAHIQNLIDNTKAD